MDSRKRHFLAAAILLGAGGLRLLWEPALTRSYEAAGLLSPPLQLGVKEKIGQAKWAVTLGGLRSLAATFTYLKAYDQFASQHWSDLAKTFDTTVQLSPHSRYYWDIGAWHMAKNASSYYVSDSTLNPIRARAERQRWFQKGKEFLERGVRNNPHDAQLRISLAQLYEDPFLYPDDTAASEQYEKAIELGADQAYIQRSYLRSLARSGTDPAKTRAMLEELLKVRQNRVPTLLCMEFASIWADQTAGHPQDPIPLAVRIFGSEEKALKFLGPYFTSVRDRWPQDGVEQTIRLLEGRAGIAPDDPRSNIRLHDEAVSNVREWNNQGLIPDQK
jgi:hypothetical protein